MTEHLSPAEQDATSETYDQHMEDMLKVTPVTIKDVPQASTEEWQEERRDNRRLIAELTKLVSAANRKVEELKIDNLTGLPNRHKFSEEYPSIFNRRNVSLLFIDARGLKQINNSVSPAKGDKYLRTVADLIIETKRAEDRVYRVGGDEFILLAETNPEKDLDTFVERVKTDIENGLAADKELKLPEEFDKGVYVGGASKRDGDTPEDLQERAGQACSLAKQQFKGSQKS